MKITCWNVGEAAETMLVEKCIELKADVGNLPSSQVNNASSRN